MADIDVRVIVHVAGVAVFVRVGREGGGDDGVGFAEFLRVELIGYVVTAVAVIVVAIEDRAENARNEFADEFAGKAVGVIIAIVAAGAIARGIVIASLHGFAGAPELSCLSVVNRTEERKSAQIEKGGIQLFEFDCHEGSVRNGKK